MFSGIRVFLLAALAATTPATLLAQHTLTGTVQDERGAVVPFAVVELPAQKLGVQADDEGRFSFPLPAGLTSTDSLAVSALGYQRRRVAVPAGAAVSLRLAALPVSLNEVVVRGKKAAPVLVGALEVTTRHGYGQSGLSQEKNTGWQIGYLLEAPPAGYIDEVRFFINKRGVGNCKDGLQAPFRLRLYAIDSLTHLPGADLLLTSVISAATAPGWHTVDVRRFNVKVPPTGFCAAMEWIYTDDKFLCEVKTTYTQEKKKGTLSIYGQSLRATTTNGHIYSYSAGRGWRKMSNSDPAIQILIQP